MTRRRGVLLAAGNRSSSNTALWSNLYGSAPADVMLVIDQPVILDINATVHGLEIEGEGQLIFDPNTSRLLQVDQQRPVCVMEGGHLEMVPASASITHELRFINVDEELYTEGGGMNHTANPGLCVENGTVTLRGATKRGWTRTTHALLAGATSCTVVEATGWRIGDEVVITPTEASSVANHQTHFDRRTLTNVVGNVLTFAATTYPHPSNTSPTGVIIYPEVVNLTRNVKITGQDATHRAQIMFMEDCTGSILEYFEGRYLGPRKMQPGLSPQPMLIIGRYCLHFHLMGEGSRGINVTGVSMHDGGSRGFVPHGSHGMTFYDCVAWDVFSNGYWWDVTLTTERRFSDENESNDLLYDRCFAGLIRLSDVNPGGTRNSGFHLVTGENMTIRNCCVAGIYGVSDTAGYAWPQEAGGGRLNAVWVFEDNDAHNNVPHGIFNWQNTPHQHDVVRFRGWNNGEYGIRQGAYRNSYHFIDNQLWGNGGTGDPWGDFVLGALTNLDLPYRQFQYTGGTIEVLVIGHHNLGTGTNPCLFRNVDIGTVHVLEPNAGTNGALVDFVDCGIDPDDFIVTDMDVDSVYRVQLGAQAWQITNTTGTGAGKVVTPIALFAPEWIYPEDFGAVGDGVANDHTALQNALNALTASKVLIIRYGKVYNHNAVLTWSTGGRIVGPGRIHATVQTASSFQVTGTDQIIESVRFSSVNTSRGSALAHHKVVITGLRTHLIQVVITSSHAAGLYLSGATDTTVDDTEVLGARGDGILMTNGTTGATFSFPIVEDVGGDGIAVVSYSTDPATSSDILVSVPLVKTAGGRGMAIIGGTGIQYREVTIEDTVLAGVYIATEPSPSSTYQVFQSRVTVTSIVRANSSPSVAHGDIYLWAGHTTNISAMTIDTESSVIYGSIEDSVGTIATYHVRGLGAGPGTVAATIKRLRVTPNDSKTLVSQGANATLTVEDVAYS